MKKSTLLRWKGSFSLIVSHGTDIVTVVVFVVDIVDIVDIVEWSLACDWTEGSDWLAAATLTLLDWERGNQQQDTSKLCQHDNKYLYKSFLLFLSVSSSSSINYLHKIGSMMDVT